MHAWNKHLWNEKLRWLLWHRNWHSTKAVFNELKRIIETYTTLQRDFLAKNLETWEIEITFDKIDNPMNKHNLFELIIDLENTLKSFPEFWELTMMSKENIHILMLEYTKLREFIVNQYTYFTWTLKKYEHWVDYIYEIIFREKKKKLEEEYADVLSSSPKEFEKIMVERQEKLDAIEHERDISIKKLEEEYNELINNQEATNLDRKNAIKELKLEFKFKDDAVIELYEVKARNKEHIIQEKARLIKNSMTKASISSDILLSDVYNDIVQKKQILGQTVLYLENWIWTVDWHLKTLWSLFYNI